MPNGYSSRRNYNYSVPGVLKNAVDWASRPYCDSAWDGKPAAIMGASIGNIATARAQYHLRQIFVFLNIHAINQPEVMIGNAADRFDADGNLTDDATKEYIRKLPQGRSSQRTMSSRSHARPARHFAGVILALVTPTLPPANLRALMAQAEAILQAETRMASERVLRHGPSEPAMRALDAIHARIESPADKLLRSMEPWSSYVMLPVFALANAGVILSFGVFETHNSLMLAIILGLVVGKPVGIFVAAWLAVRFGIALKPKEYSWRQLAGAGALAGIGFTMSLFIAGEAFPQPADFAAAKIAIFIASLVAGLVGAVILWPKTGTGNLPQAAPAPP